MMSALGSILEVAFVRCCRCSYEVFAIEDEDEYEQENKEITRQSSSYSASSSIFSLKK